MVILLLTLGRTESSWLPQGVTDFENLYLDEFLDFERKLYRFLKLLAKNFPNLLTVRKNIEK